MLGPFGVSGLPGQSLLTHSDVGTSGEWVSEPVSSNLGMFTRSLSENWGGGMLIAGSKDKDRVSVKKTQWVGCHYTRVWLTAAASPSSSGGMNSPRFMEGGLSGFSKAGASRSGSGRRFLGGGGGTTSSSGMEFEPSSVMSSNTEDGKSKKTRGSLNQEAEISKKMLFLSTSCFKANWGTARNSGSSFFEKFTRPHENRTRRRFQKTYWSKSNKFLGSKLASENLKWKRKEKRKFSINSKTICTFLRKSL